MKTIIVASTNPVKLQAARMGFARMFPGQDFDFRAVSVPSGVADQPFSNRETLQGALNRARNAQSLTPDADYWVGIEGGVEEDQLVAENPVVELTAFAWMVVLGKDPSLTGKGRTGTFYLPPQVAALVRSGKELGEADDIVFGRANSKQENGAVGLLTGDVIDRTIFYEHAMVLALIPFKREDLWTSRS